MDRQQKGMSLKGFDYIELYVGDARQAAHFYRTAFGFRPVGYAGLETGERDRISFVMEQGQIRLILTAAIVPESQVAEYVRAHGDGIKDIAFEVDDAARAYAVAVERGATPVMEPMVFEGRDGRLIKSTIAACGQTVHSFIQRDSGQRDSGQRDSGQRDSGQRDSGQRDSGQRDSGQRDNGRDNASSTFFPQYRAVTEAPPVLSTGLEAIDHIAISVEKGALDQWIDFYEKVLDFHQSHEEDVFTEYSAMNSKVVQNSNQKIKFPIMEPALGRRRSQIEEYLEFNHGSGAQHVAFLSGDIIKTVRRLRENGIEFLFSPEPYYQTLEGRIGKIDEDLGLLRELNILVDRDQWGYLLQIFSRPLQSRPTLFVEIIQRIGARGFGSGNIKALFEAVEREQAARGNL